MKTSIYSDEHCASLCQQLYLMYNAGMPLESGLSLLKSPMKAYSHEFIRQRLKAVGHLSQVLREEGHFPSLLVETLAVAEKVGQEAKICAHLADYYQSQMETKTFLKDILRMPLVLLSMLMIVMGVLSYAVLPVFQDVYASLGGQNPWWINGLLSFIRSLSMLGLVALVLILGVALFQSFMHYVNPSRYLSASDAALNLLPSHRFSQDLAHFSFLAQVLLASGLDQKEALNLLKIHLKPGQLKRRIDQVLNNMLPHEGLYELLIQAKLYPALLQNTLELSAKTGQLEESMMSISHKMSDEANQSLQKALNRIEPTLVLVLTLFVSTVLFSLIIPLLGVIQVMGLP